MSSDDDGSSFNFVTLTSNELSWWIAFGAIPFVVLFLFPELFRKALSDDEKHVGFFARLLRHSSTLTLLLSLVFGQALFAAMWKGLDIPTEGFVGRLGGGIAFCAGCATAYGFYQMLKKLDRR